MIQLLRMVWLSRNPLRMVIASPPLYGYHSTLKAVSSGERCDSNEMENFSDNFPNIRNLLINLDMGISFVVAYFPISSKAGWERNRSFLDIYHQFRWLFFILSGEMNLKQKCLTI